MKEPQVAFPFPDHPGPEPPREIRELWQMAGGDPIPAVLAGGPARLVLRHGDVQQVLADERFSRAIPGARNPMARSRESLALMGAEPPDHTRRRRLLARMFTARRAEQARPGIRRTADDLLAGLTRQGPPADVIPGFALPLASRVIFEMMGVPTDDVYRLRGPVRAMMSTAGHTPEQVAAGQQEIFDYFAGHLDAAIARYAAGDGTDDVLGELARAVADGTLGRNEAVHLGYGLLIAGYETTTNQLGMCVYELTQRPELVARLLATPDDLPAAVEELLRWTSMTASRGMPHVALEDVQLGDTVIQAGEIVLPMIDAGNRDPHVFAEPDAFDVDRAPHANLTFGYGRHHCLGAALARTEIQIAIAALLEHWPGLRLAVPAEQLQWRDGMYVRGLWHLPLQW